VPILFHRRAEQNFLSTLKVKAERQFAKFPNAFDIEAIRRCRTIGDFDDAFIAKIYKFEDKTDYYRKTGSKWALPHIRVPAVAINALDDPFIEEAALPHEEDIGAEAPVRVIYHAHGGHCGFVTAPEATMNADTGMGESDRGQQPIPSHGWLAEEMGRALSHIHAASSTTSS
jgi:uncharacterized protein